MYCLQGFSSKRIALKVDVIGTENVLFARIFIKTHSIESRCYRNGECAVCGRVRASFSPEILQSAGAVKGLKINN